MTLKTIAKGAVPVAVVFAAFGLTFRYFGDKPIIEDIRKGLNGDVKGLFK